MSAPAKVVGGLVLLLAMAAGAGVGIGVVLVGVQRQLGRRCRR